METFDITGTNNKTKISEQIIVQGVIQGNNNYIQIDSSKKQQRLQVYVYGDNNKIVIGRNSNLNNLRIETGSKKYQSHNTILEIGEGFSIASKGRFLLPNIGNTILIGKNCMFSNNIIIRGGEFPHLIFDKDTGQYLDVSEGIFIGSHVWVGEQSYINKSATIPNDCIIGAQSVVTKRFEEEYCVIAGSPAKVVKRNVVWLSNQSQLEVDSKAYQSLIKTRKQKLDSTPNSGS